MKHLWLAGYIACILSMLLLAGCDKIPSGGTSSSTGNSSASTPQKPSGNPPTAIEESVPIKVYFATHDAQHLVAETHKVKKNAPVLQQSMEALIAGPKNSALLAVIPAGTRVKSVHVIDGTAYVDFSSEMIKKGFGGSSMEILTVGAIVNTLTEFSEVERVQILVEGKKVNTLFGHLDVSDPLSRSPDIIKGK